MSMPTAPIRPRHVLPQILAGVWVPLCFAFAGANQNLLPDKYFQDSQHIEGLELAATGPSPDAFVTTAWLYRLLGGFEYPAVTRIATLALFFVLVFRCASWMDISRFRLTEIVLFCFAGLEAAIYLAQYSKESIVLLVVLALVLAPRRLIGDISFVLLACGYAYLNRPYWFIICALYVAVRWLLRSRRPGWVPVFVAITMLCLAVGATAALGVDLGAFRQTVAQSNSLYAQSAIQDYVPASGPLGAAANALCTLVLLVVPVPLLVTGAPVYVVFAGLMALLWISLFAVVLTGMRSGRFIGDVRLSRATALLLATLITLAIFEPDYGSYIKHLTPLLPLFFFPLRALHDSVQPASHPLPPHPQPQERTSQMRLSTICRTVIRHWYLTLAGVLFSAALAAGVFALAPPQFTSSGTGLLVQPKRLGLASADNPMLSGTGSVNTTTMALVEALSAPGVGNGLGLDPAAEKFTVKNVGKIAMADGADHPFLYVTAQGATPQRSVQIVDGVLDLAQTYLVRTQQQVRVPPRNRISLQTVVAPTPPRPVLITRMAFAGAAFALGLVATCVAACGRAAILSRRAHHRPVQTVEPVPLSPQQRRSLSAQPLVAESRLAGR